MASIEMQSGLTLPQEATQKNETKALLAYFKAAIVESHPIYFPEKVTTALFLLRSASDDAVQAVQDGGKI